LRINFTEEEIVFLRNLLDNTIEECEDEEEYEFVSLIRSKLG